MHRVVLLSDDNRAIIQIRGWLRELEQDIWFESYREVRAFEEYFSKPKKPPLPPGALDERIEESRRRQMMAETLPVRILIVDVDIGIGGIKHWLTKLQKEWEEFQYSIEGVETKIIVIGYESEQFSAESMKLPCISDLLYKPVDPSLFQQRIESVLSERKHERSNFLFSQQADFEIEIGKDVEIQEVSDFGIGFINPSPLAIGLCGRLHSPHFSQNGNEDSSVLIRVYECTRAGSQGPGWSVRAYYVAVNAAQAESIRGRVLRFGAVSAPPQAEDGKMGDSLQAKPVRVALIDMDKDMIVELQRPLRELFAPADVVHFPGISRFMDDLQRAAGDLGRTAALNEAEAFSRAAMGAIPAPKVVAEISIEDHMITSFPGMGPLAVVLGKSVQEWDLHPGDFKKLILPLDVSDFEDYLRYLAGGGQATTRIRFVMAKQMVFVDIKGRLDKQGDHGPRLRLELKQIEEHEYIKWADENARVKDMRFDAIYMDISSLRGDSGSLFEAIRNLIAKSNGLDSLGRLPPVCILAEEGTEITVELFQRKEIVDCLYKPIDRRLASSKMGVIISAPKKKGAKAIDFRKGGFIAYLCKTTRIEQVAEYGIVISHPSPLKEGVFLRFFSKVFGPLKNGIIGRSTGFEAVEGQETYKVFFSFFGPTDELLKRIRQWIREDYVNRKEGKSA